MITSGSNDWLTVRSLAKDNPVFWKKKRYYLFKYGMTVWVLNFAISLQPCSSEAHDEVFFSPNVLELTEKKLCTIQGYLIYCLFWSYFFIFSLYFQNTSYYYTNIGIIRFCTILCWRTLFWKSWTICSRSLTNLWTSSICISERLCPVWITLFYQAVLLTCYDYTVRVDKCSSSFTMF